MTTLFDKLLSALRQRYCKHLFLGPDMGRRDETGLLSWSCSKCRKLHRLTAGYLAPGNIDGPWGITGAKP